MFPPGDGVDFPPGFGEHLIAAVLATDQLGSGSTTGKIMKKMIALALLACACAARAEILFSDDFSSGASSLWGNEVGAWSANAGVYGATQPANMPNAISSLPFNLTNFSVDFDINAVGDGGIFLRSTVRPGTTFGVQGVALVLKVPDGGPKIYWHVFTNGNDASIPLNITYTDFGFNPHVHVEVSGATYSAFLNGSSTPATTLNTSAFPSGQVALYDFSSQTFDNFVLQVPAVSGKIIRSKTVPYVLQVSWQSTPGAWYQVQGSGKGVHKWVDVGDPQLGTGSEMSALVQVSPEQKFFRVKMFK
jgi:hypothetical protein